MTIPHFADQQNLVFVPALLALLVATVLICMPIVFAPALRRGRGGRGGRNRLTVVVAGLLAAVALVVTGWQAGIGVRTLQNERAQVQTDVRTRYGIELPPGDANELINGGSPKLTLPQLAAQVGLANPQISHSLQAIVTAPGADTYGLTFGKKPVPATTG